MSAIQLLEEAEQLDGYRRAIAASAPNAYARRHHSYTPFFVEEDAARFLQKEVDAIPLLADTDIIVMNPTADEGYPHTRAANLVAIPSKIITESSPAKLAETLRHEAMHIDQRRRPYVWAAACMERGWWPVPPAQIPPAARTRCRINPDTMHPQPFWAWEGYHVPLPLFSSEHPSSLGDIVIKWLDTRSQTLYKDPPSSFLSTYGSAPSQPEHPYELLAVDAAEKGIFTQEALDVYLRQKE